jgi:hypothetical protein
MSAIARIPVATISIGKMHAGQIAAFRALQGHRLKALRCGRRFGKTDLGKIWIGDGLARGLECGWFAPQHNTWSEVYAATVDTFRPILGQASKSAAVIRMKTGGRLDFWTLGNAIAGRGRRYHRIVIDEAAFTKEGDNTHGSGPDRHEDFTSDRAALEQGVDVTLSNGLLEAVFRHDLRHEIVLVLERGQVVLGELVPLHLDLLQHDLLGRSGLLGRCGGRLRGRSGSGGCIGHVGVSQKG